MLPYQPRMSNSCHPTLQALLGRPLEHGKALPESLYLHEALAC